MKKYVFFFERRVARGCGACYGDMFTPDSLYASGVHSVTLVASVEFTPDGLYDSGGVSTTPETGNTQPNTLRFWLN